MTYNYL